MDAEPSSKPTRDLLSFLQSNRFQDAIERLNPVLLWAAIAGLLTGYVGGVFRLLVSFTLNHREKWIASFHHSGVGLAASVLASGVLVFLGFLLMRRVAPETSGSGIPQIEGALDGFFTVRWQRVLPIKFLTGVLVLGAGMVMGREGPTIQIGGSVGKMVSTWFRSSKEQGRILVAASAGAGLTTAFNAPLSGILFVFEEMRPTFQNQVTSYRAVAIACIMATISLRQVLGQQPTLILTEFKVPPLSSLWIFAILGICFGFIGYAFNALLVRCLDAFEKLKGWPHQLIGLFVGGFVGFMCWLYAPTTGGGEEMIIWAFDTVEPSSILFLLFAVRFAMTLLCYGSGSPGGLFAPMLSLGTLFGLAVAYPVQAWFPYLFSQPDILTIASMGALVAATVRAPLTAILLTIEITANYLLILPILLSCLMAAMTAHGLGGRPIYTVLLERRLAKTNPTAECPDENRPLSF